MPAKPIQDFPSISEVEEHIEQGAKPGPPKIPWTRWVIGFLAILILAMWISVSIPGSLTATLSSKGGISGRVVNEKSTPIPADISVLRTDLQTAADTGGSFSLQNIPAGSHSVIIGYGGVGVEFPVLVEAGKTIDLGQIEVETTALPPSQ
jgi:hypothetical protein